MNKEELEKIKKEIIEMIPKLVKAAVAAIIIKDNKILLEKRSSILETGKWCLPGGAIEFGETAEAAIKREIKEEIGLETLNLKFLGYQDEIISRIKNHSLVLVFKAETNGIQKFQKNEVAETRWFDKKDLTDLEFAYSHKEIINKYFNP